MQTLPKRALISTVFLALVAAGLAAAFPLLHHGVAAHQATHFTAPDSPTVHQDVDGNPSRAGSPSRPAAASPQSKTIGGSSASMPYVVLFVLDGARPDYLSVPGISHVRALMRSGTQYTNAWAGILESETPSGHAALATGSEPSADGVLSFNWAAGDNLPVNLFDPSAIRSGAMERIISHAGVPTLAGLVHRRDPGARVVALSGHKYYAADALGGPDADVIMYYTGTPDGRFVPEAQPGHMPPADLLDEPDLSYGTSRLPPGVEDHLTMRLAMRSFERMHQQVTLINVPEFDWPLGHVEGGDRDPSMVRTLMQGFDRDLAQLEDVYRRAGVLDRTLFVITADHGFAPIYHTVSKDLITRAVSDTGTSIIEDTYHTGAYLWLRDESWSAAAAANVAKLKNPYIQAVYFREATPSGVRYVRATGTDLFRAPDMETANQYLLHTFTGANSPDVVVLFAEDAGSEPDGQASWKGDHGGAAWESQHIPLVLSGPGVRPGGVSTQPARLMDIAPTVLDLLGVQPTGMQGIVLADGMQHPDAGSRTREWIVGSALRNVVTTLQSESYQDVKAGR